MILDIRNLSKVFGKFCPKCLDHTGAVSRRTVALARLVALAM